MATKTKTRVKPGVPDDKKMLDVTTVAEMLNVSTRKVYRLASTGKLRRVKLGWTTRFRAADVERLMDKGCGR